MGVSRRRSVVAALTILALVALLLVGRAVLDDGEAGPRNDGRSPVAEGTLAASPSGGDRMDAALANPGPTREEPPAPPEPAAPEEFPNAAPPPPPRDGPRPGEDAVAMGRVVDSVTGKPIDGAEVEILVLDGGRQRRTATTDADGQFRLEDIPRNSSLQVRVSKIGFVRAFAPLESTLGSADDISVSLAPASRIRGTVVNPEGKPVAGARVTMDGVNGYHRIDMNASSRLRLFARLPTKVRSIYLESLSGSSRSTVTTDSDGRYELNEAPVSQALTIHAAADGYSPSELRSDVVIPPGSSGEVVNLVLRKNTSLALRMLLPPGVDEPEQFWVVAEALGGLRPFLRGDDGRWVISGITGGTTWYFVEGAPLGSVLDSVEVKPGETTEIEVSLGTGETLSGRVVDGKKRGIEGIEVIATPTRWYAEVSGLWTRVRTDAGGQFSIRGLGDGEYGISLQFPGEHFEMSGGQHRAPARDLQLSAPGSLAFRLVPAVGGTLPDWETVTLAHSQEGATYLHDVYRRDGVRFDPETGIVRVARTYPGKTTLAVKVPDFIEVRRTAEVPAGGEGDFGDIVLVPSLWARGRVLDPEGKPVPNASVIAWYEGGIAAPATTDAKGAFELRDLAPGEATLEVYDSGSDGRRFALKTWKWTFAAGLPPFDLVVEPGASIRVRVVDTAGLPVTVAQVTCEAPNSKYRPVPRLLVPTEEPGEYDGRRPAGEVVVNLVDPTRPMARKLLATKNVKLREDRETLVELTMPD